MRPRLSLRRNHLYRYCRRRFLHTGIAIVIGRLHPMVGSCRRSRHRSFSSRRGAVEVRANDDYDDDYDDDENGEERYVTLLLLLLLFR